MAENRMHRGRESCVKGLVVGAALAVLVAWPVRADDCVTVEQWRLNVIKGTPSLAIGESEPVQMPLYGVILNKYNTETTEQPIGPDVMMFMLMARDRKSGYPVGDALFGFFVGGCKIGPSYLVPLPHGKSQPGEPV
jgi:hypothetical protein